MSLSYVLYGRLIIFEFIAVFVHLTSKPARAKQILFALKTFDPKIRGDLYTKSELWYMKMKPFSSVVRVNITITREVISVSEY